MARKPRKWLRLLMASVFGAEHSAQASSCEYGPGICSSQAPERGVQQVGATQQIPPGVFIDTPRPFEHRRRPMPSYMFNAQPLVQPEVPPGVFINTSRSF